MLTAIQSFVGSFAAVWAMQPAPAPEAPSAASPVRCARFAPKVSSAFDSRASAITLPWRTDLPATAPATVHPWATIRFRTNWQDYMAAVLAEVEDSGLQIANDRITMNPEAGWWITPWMDYGTNGREARLGLTKERGPDAGDLSSTSTRGPQVWAIGFYNAEGAVGLRQIFGDPCNPTRPAMGWTFPAGTVSFKLLFTDASPTQVDYLDGAPTVLAMIDPPGASTNPNVVPAREERTLRLLQIDIAVRDPDAPLGWVFGTFIWRNAGASTLFGNLAPVGLMWGNDPTAAASPRDAFATLSATRLNPALAGVVWRGTDAWPERPWPGFQGRLNGPADNLRSSCMSCHALSQWPRSRDLNIVPRVSFNALDEAPARDELRRKYLRDVAGGSLTEPAEAAATTNWGGATPLDYSLQVEAAFSRMCQACADGALTGPTPGICRIRGARPFVPTATCPLASSMQSLIAAPARRQSPPARQ